MLLSTEQLDDRHKDLYHRAVYRRRYGDIRRIAGRTSGLCHLCYRAVDLSTYGNVCEHGPVTASVDHITPRKLGGDDRFENLLIAHQGCNSRRGTRDASEARRDASGRTGRPKSRSEQFLLVMLSTVLWGVVGFFASFWRATRAQTDDDRRCLVARGILGTTLGTIFGVLFGGVCAANVRMK